VGNPLVAQAQSSTTWYTGLGLVEDAAQVSSGIQNDSWVDGTLGTVGGALDIVGMAIDPLGSLVAWGVSWLMEHVKPLKDALDWLAGNPDEISAHAQTWENVAKYTLDAQQQFSAAIKAETADWIGPSGDAYRQHAGTHLTVMEGISKAAHGIHYGVMGAGLIVGLVRGIVRDLIAQFIGTLAARLPQWLAEAGLTLGLGTPVVIGQVVALVSKWVNKIQGFLRALLSSLKKLIPMLNKLGDILTKLKELLRKLGRSGPARNADDLPTGGRSGWKPGDPIPPPRTGDDLPANTNLLGKYVGENDPDLPHPPRAFRTPVQYMDEAQREAHRLVVGADGKLYRASDGQPFDTAGGTTAWSGNGRAIFVMDGHGNLYASLDQRVGHTHHSSFLGGQPVAGAGEIEVQGGTLVAMTDQSGHYHPAAETNDLALQNLRDQGLTTGDGFKQYGWGGEER